MTLLFAILTKNASFGSCSTIVYPSCAYPQYKYAYIHSAPGHELSGCVRADAYNLILIFASYYYASWPCIIILHMIREKHVILKATFCSGLYSCLVAANYIIMLCCL